MFGVVTLLLFFERTPFLDVQYTEKISDLWRIRSYFVVIALFVVVHRVLLRAKISIRIIELEELSGDCVGVSSFVLA